MLYLGSIALVALLRRGPKPRTSAFLADIPRRAKAPRPCALCGRLPERRGRRPGALLGSRERGSARVGGER